MANLKYTINTYSYQKGIRSLGFSTPESVVSNSQKFAEILNSASPVEQQPETELQPVETPIIQQNDFVAPQEQNQFEQNLASPLSEELNNKVEPKQITTPSNIIPNQEQQIEQSTDFTPIIQTPVQKQVGERLDDKISKTGFIQKSPYNMSDETAKRLAEVDAQKSMTRPISENDKVFPLNQATKFTGNTKMLPPELAAKTAKDKSSLNQVDINKIKDTAINMPDYPREALPNVSKQPTSPAASWFPQAMTRQLDMYESMKKVQQQEQSGSNSVIPTDLKI
ncbi:MAG: hypothetical protein MJ250_06275 [Alphaproteobacteria bacterium]|nr:hypothetical protein [Alphaproteobacteria bacterium]